ncbi:MAG: cytochrome c [Myxococcales bacterium]
MFASARASAGEGDVRQAAALLDYVARSYRTAVVDGRVINPSEFEEQQVFASQAAEILGRIAEGEPFRAEAADLAGQVREKADVQAVSALATSLHGRLLAAAGLSTSPPPDVPARAAEYAYQQACTACHGVQGRGDGFAARTLETRPTDFTGADRAELTPYRVYSAVTFGVPRTAMPAFESLGDDQRWQIAIWTLAFGHSDEDARRGERIAGDRGLSAEGRALVARSDADVRRVLAERGFSPDDAAAVLAWVRRMVPFAPPTPRGFPQLSTQVALASISYVHGRIDEARQRLRDAEAQVWWPLEPLVRAAAPGRIDPVRSAFRLARAAVDRRAERTRVLAAAAQVMARIGEAGPEQLPDPAVQREAGAMAALRDGLLAAAALLCALLLAAGAGARGAAAFAAAVGVAAGTALAARAVWTPSAAAGAEVACAAAFVVALAFWIAGRGGAAAAAIAGSALAATLASAEAATSCAAVAEAFASPVPEMVRGAIFAGATLGLSALVLAAAAAVLRGRARWLRFSAAALLLACVSAAIWSAAERVRIAWPLVSSLAAAAPPFWGADRLRLWW